MAYDVATGCVLYEFTSGSLGGSWDTRVSVQVKRQKWVCPMGKPPAQLVDCAPYLVVEGSVHKALMGHNLFGGPCDPAAACRWFLAEVAGRLQVEFPASDDWTVERLDWAEVYDLGCYAAVEEYVHRLNAAVYPRRRVVRYGVQSLSAPGQVTSLKLYHKGPEFRAHDAKRLSRVHTPEDVSRLAGQADRLLRFEVEVLRRKLEQGGQTLVKFLEGEFFEEVYDREAGRLLREGQCDMERVRSHREVKARLEKAYPGELASRLFGTWMQFAALGEQVVRGSMNRATFYRQRKQLADVGVEWQGADVRIVAQLSLVPDGFAPLRSDSRRLGGEHSSVLSALEPFRTAA
jgi:II/X family phage/plasmid replication protein